MSAKNTYLITGGEGFIGYHLCRALSEDGTGHVVSYDAQKHWIDDDTSRWHTCHPYRMSRLDDEAVTRVEGDTRNRDRLVATLERYDPDVVVHLAALPLATVSAERPEEARRNIFDGTLTLLNALADADTVVDRLVYVSSSMVYGDFETDGSGTVVPAVEDQDCKPKSVYGALKLGGEHLVRQADVSHTIVRPSAVYGPTDCNRRVVEIFLRRAVRGDPLRLDNGGHHELDFTYVQDLARGLTLAATHEAAENETFNMTRGEGRSIRELASVIGSHVGDVETYTETKERTRPRRGALDISKGRDLLGYEPTYSLEEGIQEYVDFVQRNGLIDVDRRQIMNSSIIDE